MELSRAPAKEKRKNSEKRKEKSRDAARNRRSLESKVFSDLAAVLPLPTAVVAHLDKASIMRLVITHLRLLNLFKSIELTGEEDSKKYDNFYLKASGGFVLMLSTEGEIMFVSQNVSNYLGITQVDVLGQNVSEITHPCDQGEVNELFSGKISVKDQQAFFLRMKCIASKGRGINSKSSAYKVVRIVGRFVKMGGSTAEDHCFISLASPIPHPSDIEMPLGRFTFLSQHSLDMKFTFADERMQDFLGYNPRSLLGKSVYDFHHAEDNRNIEKAFKGLFSRGQSETDHYRFLALDGGYVWVTTQAAVIYCEKTSKPQSVVCVNYIVSGKCEEDKIYSVKQLDSSIKKEPISRSAKCEQKVCLVKPFEPVPETILAPVPVTKKRPVGCTKSLLVNIKAEVTSPLDITKPAAEQNKFAEVLPPPPRPKPPSGQKKFAEVLPPPPRPKPATREIFAPKTADMNSGFMKSDEEPGTTSILDDFALPDLTHLAPTAGDACVPLETPPISEMIKMLGPGDEIAYPMIDCGKDPTLQPGSLIFSAFRDEYDHSPLNQSPVSYVDALGMAFDDTAMKTILGYEDDFNAYDDALSEETLPMLLPVNIPWGELTNNVTSDSASQGSLSPICMKKENSIQDFGQFLPSPDIIIPDNTESLLSKISLEPDARKRVLSIGQEGIKKRKHQNVQDPGGGADSVLMNLLVTGHDLNAGYNICLDSRKSISNRT